MLGLPSTTEVGRRLPKEAFYRNIKLDTRTRDEFVHLIERIEIANSIKPATANVASGECVDEILVLTVQLKGEKQPVRAIEAIAGANPHKLIFHTEPDGDTYVVRKGLHKGQLSDGLTLTGSTLDEVWDSLCAQVIFGDVNGTDIDNRIETMRHRATLEAEIATLDQRVRKAKQINRKNELFALLQTKRCELEKLLSYERGN